MKAYELPKSGAGIDALTRVERPDPPKPGHRQVLVKVRACSLNFRDLGIVRGSYRMPVREKVIPLSDGAGEVVEAGAGVSRVKPGDRVCGHLLPALDRGAGAASDIQPCGAGRHGADGMLTDNALLEGDGVVHVPENFSLDQEAATLPCAAVTAWNGLVEAGGVAVGDAVVLLLGTGGVSIFGLQFAKAAGAARHRRLEQRGEARQGAPTLGASEAINSKTVPEWQDRVRAAPTGGRGVDHVLDVTGGETTRRNRSPRHAARRNPIAIIGARGAARAAPSSIGARSCSALPQVERHQCRQPA